jgi:SpoIID/LytB domain protein
MQPEIKVGLTRTDASELTLNGDYEINCNSDAVEYIPLSADAVTEISHINIGESFHWQHQDSLTLPGKIIYPIEGNRFYNILPLERYLECVVSSEMNPESELEFLKAHAIISRSWAMRAMTISPTDKSDNTKKDYSEKIITWEDNHSHVGFHVCNEDHCQRYHGLGAVNDKALKAVRSTYGKILIDKYGEIVDARYSKCCGGMTEIFSTCWQDKNYDYLISQHDPYCNPNAIPEYKQALVLRPILKNFDFDTNNFYTWEECVPASLIADNLKHYMSIELGLIMSIKPLKRGPSGRIFELQIIGEKGSVVVGKELTIRRLLSTTALRSSAFEILSTEDTSTFKLKGIGWGHGVGLCQIGAAIMASKGATCKEILKFYFPNTIIKQMYE